MSSKGDASPGPVAQEKADELARLLLAGVIEEFMKLFKECVRSDSRVDVIALTDQINMTIHESNPDCGVKLVVSQKNQNDKHLIMITDASRFFGDAWTVTRQIFSV